MACSATLPQSTLKYIHKSLHLERPTVLCDMPTDRVNITLFTAPISKGEIQNRRPLLDLIPGEAAAWDPAKWDEGQWNPLKIPKTLVFIDDRMQCCTLTTELINKFPSHVRQTDGRDIVREYHSTMSAKTLECNLQALRDGICRIMVCTDAVGMGLDVPDIQRVIQWRVPEWLTVAGWWQRAGRAARDPKISGMAVIYYEPVLKVDADSPFRGSYDQPDELERVCEALKMQTTEPESDADADAEAITQHKTRKGGLAREGHLLWYLNSGGCIRDIAMHYLGSKPECRIPFDMDNQGAPCCDRCYKDSAVSPDDFIGFPVRSCTAFAGAVDDADDEPEELSNDIEDMTQPVRGVKISRHAASRISLAMRLALNIWRHENLGQYHIIDPKLRAKHIMCDAWIDKLSSKCFDVKQASDISKVLSGAGPEILPHTRLATRTE
jgi:hypothetical protein